MNLQGYISSGILEQYLLGIASSEEVREVEELAAQHPEIRQELDAVSQALESFAGTHRVEPPAGLKEKILQRVEGAPKQQPKGKPAADVRQASAARTSGEAASSSFSPLAALLALALLGACVAAFLFLRQASAAKEEASAAQALAEQVRKECDEARQRDQQLQKQFADLRHWATQPVQMKGTELSKSSFAVVYQNSEGDFSYLDVVNLPPPPAGKQYQLWAIVGGKPADMGVFEVKSDSGALQTVPYIENAQAYAVTLEQAGGSPTPTLEQMYVIGNVGKS